MEFKPFDKVLVRFSSNDTWNVNFFGYKDKNNKDFPYFCCGDSFKECIPFIDNEHLLGTINPYTPNWEPKYGELILAADGLPSPSCNKTWIPVYFNRVYRVDEDNRVTYECYRAIRQDTFEDPTIFSCIKPIK